LVTLIIKTADEAISLYRILVVAKDPEKIRELNAELGKEGFYTLVKGNTSDVLADSTQKGFDVAVVDLETSSDSTLTEVNWNQLKELKEEKHLPIIVLVSQRMILAIESATDIDDFVVVPCNLTELVTRIKRILKKRNSLSNEEIISYGGLLIDTAKCEVFLEGSLLSLTFREYELLKFLATNKGRVFSRDNLLNEVWGYDYYGGDRTVDVHVRRLRSKIEDSSHTFINTVRNIGYKFREDNYSPASETS
jgi:DNA-binding response OmpR family regulator